MKSPWSVKAAATLIVLRPIANLLHALYLGSGGPPVHFNFWVGHAVFEIIGVAIAYGVIRGINVIRILLAITVVCGELFGLRISLALFPIYAFVEASFAIGIVSFLFVPLSNNFFRNRGSPNQSTDPTLASGTSGARHQPRHP
jgi:hypothetical protein